MFGLPKEVFTDLLRHYQNLGLNATLLEKDSPETIDKETAIKVVGRKFDLVMLKFAGGSVSVGGGGGFGPTISKKVTKTHPKLRFHYVIKGMGNRSAPDLRAEMKEKKTGFISKKLNDIEWKGGALAELLNNDADLKEIILGTSTTSLKVEPDEKKDCVRIIHEKGIDLIVERGGVFIKKTETKAENFPPIQTLDIIDRITEHVK